MIRQRKRGMQRDLVNTDADNPCTNHIRKLWNNDNLPCRPVLPFRLWGKPMPDPAPSNLDLQYAPRPTWARRRGKRVALAAALCVLAAAGWWWRGDIKSAAVTAKLLYAQRQCMTFDAPDGQVVYDEDPARAQGLLGQPDYVSNPLPDGKTGALWWPKAVRAFPEADRYFSGTPNKGLMFQHERTTPGGRRVLVTAMIWPQAGISSDLGLGLRAVLPGTWKADPQTCGGLWGALPEVGDYHAGRKLRVFAGRPDPADPSHFTIEYEINRGRGTWDGWVRDNPSAAPGDLPVVLELSFRPGGARG